MDPRKLTRDASKVHAVLKELPNDKLVTTKGCKIYTPVRFSERGLASVGIETWIVGIYAIVVDDKYYGVSMVNAMLRIEPTSTLKIDIDGEEFFEFYFEPGATVVSSLQLVKTDTLVFRIYDEIIAKGRVPWYLTYDDLGKLFETAKYHAGANVGGQREVTELIISMIARDSKDRTKYFRQTVKSPADAVLRPPAFISLRSVVYQATDTTTKIMGSYFSDGLQSALISPAERVERIEGLLRR
jgi:hypothetical protein